MKKILTSIFIFCSLFSLAQVNIGSDGRVHSSSSGGTVTYSNELSTGNDTTTLKNGLAWVNNMLYVYYSGKWNISSVSADSTIYATRYYSNTLVSPKWDSTRAKNFISWNYQPYQSNYATTYAMSNDVKDSILSAVRYRDTASMLSNYAKNNQVMHVYGNETIGGNKTYTSNQIFNGSITINTNGLQLANVSGKTGGIYSTNLTSNFSYQLPNYGGTFAMASDIPSITGKLNISDTSSMLSPYARSAFYQPKLSLTTNAIPYATGSSTLVSSPMQWDNTNSRMLLGSTPSDGWGSEIYQTNGSFSAHGSGFNYMQILGAASDAVGSGATVSLHSTSGNQIYHYEQLNAIGGIDYWAYDSTSGWNKYFRSNKNGNLFFPKINSSTQSNIVFYNSSTGELTYGTASSGTTNIGSSYWYNSGTRTIYLTSSTGTGTNFVLPHDSLTYSSGETIGITHSNSITLSALPNSSLTNSTISGVSLGSNLNSLTNGYGVTSLFFNGSSSASVAVDTSIISTKKDIDVTINFEQQQSYTIVYPSAYQITAITAENGTISPTIVLYGTSTAYTLGNTISGWAKLSLSVTNLGAVRIQGKIL